MPTHNLSNKLSNVSDSCEFNMNAPLSFSSDVDSKSWFSKKALPVIKKASQIGKIIIPGNAIISKVALIASVL
jgi:hypothetical protein